MILATSTTVAAQPDSTGVSIPDSLQSEGDIIWVGLAGGTAFEEFLGATQDELTTSGSVAYETGDGYFVEYAPTFVGEENPESATIIRIGYAVSQATGLRVHVGASQLENGTKAYGVWADAMKELTIDRYLRVIADYDLDSSALGVNLGYYLAL